MEGSKTGGFGKSGLTPVDSANTCYISQELNVDRELGGIETLQRNAVDYRNVDNPFLMPLDAFFVKVFLKHQELQYVNLFSWGASSFRLLKGAGRWQTLATRLELFHKY